MNKKEALIIFGFALTFIIIVGVLIYVLTSSPQFEIISHNGVLGYESFYPETRYNYTVYVNVKHNSGTNTLTLYCELTREDLTTVTKQQIVTLNIGEQEVVTFFFTNEDLKGKIPIQYRIYGEK